MKIITLGNCCQKSRQNNVNVVIAAKNCGIDEEVINIGAMNEIMAYGVMSSPALVINGKVLSTGRMLTVEQAEKFIKEAIVRDSLNKN